MAISVNELNTIINEYMNTTPERRKADMVNNVNTTLTRVSSTISYYDMKRFVEDTLGFEVSKLPSTIEPGHNTITVNTGHGSLRGGCNFRATSTYSDREKKAAKYGIDATYLRIAVNDLIGHLLWQAQLYNQSQQEMKES